MRISDWSSDVCSSDLTAEAPVSLGEFEADIPAAQNDQMVGNPVKFERLVIGERSGRREAGNRGHVRMRAQVEKQFLSGPSSCPAVVQRHLDRFRLDNARGAHDEFSPAGIVTLGMKVDEAVDHSVLASKNLLTSDRTLHG